MDDDDTHPGTGGLAGQARGGGARGRTGGRAGGGHQGSGLQGGRRETGGYHGDHGESAGLQANFRALIGVAMVEAANRGSATVEAEHLLLGFLFDRTGRGTAILVAAGLTYQEFEAALAEEREKTLAAVGVALPGPERLAAAPRNRGSRPRFGTSAKDAWHRAGKDRQRHHIRGRRWFDVDLMIGILTAELGTVPRALARAGFDRVVLLEALRATRS